MTELHDLSVREQRDALGRGELTPRELTEHYLARIGDLNSRVGALVTVTAPEALERADSLRRADSLATEAPPGALWGLPTADKDLVARAGVATHYGSAAYATNVPSKSDELALVVDEAGAISLGKTNTPEFGLAGYTESRVAPPARDPWNPANGAGGSSGGAAVAVSAGLLPFAIGSDGGGSIRIPAATVGVVGIKPSRGRLPVGSGLDGVAGLVVAGPLARTVADAALVLDALVVARPYPFAVGAPGSGAFLPAATGETRGYRIGVTTVSPWDDHYDIVVDPEATAAVQQAAASLDSIGHQVDDVDWTPVGYTELFTTLWRASAARIRLDESQLRLVEPITAWLVREGRALSAEKLLGALAAAATFERNTIAAFSGFDAVMTPALAQSPRPIGWFDAENPERNFSQQVQYAPFSSFVNVTGLPAIVVPVSQDATGHPVSVQLIGRPGGETVLIELAAQLERQHGVVHPPLW